MEALVQEADEAVAFLKGPHDLRDCFGAAQSLVAEVDPGDEGRSFQVLNHWMDFVPSLGWVLQIVLIPQGQAKLFDGEPSFVALGDPLAHGCERLCVGRPESSAGEAFAGLQM